MLIVLTSTSKIDPDKSALINTIDDPVVAITCYEYKKRSESFYTIKLHTRHDNSYPESHDDFEIAKSRLKQIIMTLFPLVLEEGADNIIAKMPFVDSDY